ncbi:MAG: FtsQ-type POTRA domain-containing protein [Proteobacteria bacterium]|nr:FtsQ-type POTRA domain-containing protein [Pseudomonadota bacterium]
MSAPVMDRFKRVPPRKARRTRVRKKRVSTPVRLFRLLRRNRTLALAGALLLALAASWQAGVFAVARDRVVMVAGDTAARAGLVLDAIEIAGLNRTTRAEMIAALGVATGDPMLGVDIVVVRMRAEALPWVREAAVARRLPGSLSVTVQERVPYALWQLKETLWLMDEGGTRITKRNLQRFSGLPLIVGEGAGEEATALFALLAEEPGLDERVRSAVRVGSRRWNLEFRNGVRLMLPEVGADYGPRDAWARFADLQRRYGLLEREVTTLDMRLDDRLVLKVTPEGRKAIRAAGHKT